MEIRTKEEFKAFVVSVEGQSGYRRPLAFAAGLVCRSKKGEVLDTSFPFTNHNQNFGAAAVFAHVTGHLAGTASYLLEYEKAQEILGYFKFLEGDGKVHDNVRAVKKLLHTLSDAHSHHRMIVVSFIDQPEHDPGPQTVSDGYLRLQLLSDKKVIPNQINLEGLFQVLPNVARTSEGPIALEELDERRFSALGSGGWLHVYAVDKIPPMLDCVVPSGVRIADASRVRLGAHLAEGTTVMHEGFCNYNAGTLGRSMIEGRISQGVIVDSDTDIGGGASTMGTLSGGGKERVRVGKRCLIGANGGIGISLGDDCVVEAGLYVTAGTPVLRGNLVVKAEELSGEDNLTFIRDGRDGQVKVRHTKNTVELNPALHKN